jgi:hypothetical protein
MKSEERTKSEPKTVFFTSEGPREGFSICEVGLANRKHLTDVEQAAADSYLSPASEISQFLNTTLLVIHNLVARSYV